ncbi:MAG: calcium-binding protein, partial [Rhodobacteraceae bacterium]|nr:calcium-binding protein [Paracoccaceae bacterium]
GRDRLIGSAGSDLMIDSQGNDIYRGGAGADMFDFTSGAGRNVIRDFGGADMLYLSAEEFADADAVLAASSQVGTSTIIDGDGYQIVLNRVSDLTSDDILLF